MRRPKRTPPQPARAKAPPDPDAVLNALIGIDEGDNFRHVIARQTLIDTLVEQPRVQAFLVRLGKQTGLARRADRVARAADRLADVLAIPHRGHLFLKPVSIDVSDLSPQTVAKLRRLHTEVEAVCGRYFKALDALPSRVVREIQRFAHKDLHLPWHYVPMDLLDYFVMGLWTRASGLPYRRGAWCAPPLIELPAIRASTLTDARTAYANALRAAEAKMVPRGYIPKKTAAVIVRNVRWFVQVTLDHIKIDTLARAYHATSHPEALYSHDWREDRAMVKKGLTNVKRLLSLTQYSYLDKSTWIKM